MDELNPAFAQLQARCEAQQNASARRLGYAIVGGLVSAPLLVFGGMWLEKRRKKACACSLPKGPAGVKGAGEAAANGNGANGNGANSNGANGNGANGNGGNGNGGNGNGTNGNGANGNGANGNGANGNGA